MTVQLLEVTRPYSVAEFIGAQPDRDAIVVTTEAALTRALDSKASTIVVDSLTALARAANQIRSEDEPKHVISSGVVAQRLEKLKRLIAAAHASPVNVIALVHVNTGSRMDEVIWEEFRALL